MRFDFEVLDLLVVLRFVECEEVRRLELLARR